MKKLWVQSAACLSLSLCAAACLIDNGSGIEGIGDPVNSSGTEAGTGSSGASTGESNGGGGRTTGGSSETTSTGSAGSNASGSTVGSTGVASLDAGRDANPSTGERVDGAAPPTGGTNGEWDAGTDRRETGASDSGTTGSRDGGTAGTTGPRDAGPETGGNDPLTLPSRCTSNKRWTSGTGPMMRPGEDCLGCHTFSIAGTVFPTGHEPDHCNGANGAFNVVITDNKGKVTTLTVNSVGNFETVASIAFPFKAKIVNTANGKERAMLTPQNDGGCNNCHTQNGDNGAPGRITVPL